MTGAKNALTIRIDDLKGHAIAELLQDHVASAFESSPESAVHALDIDGLRQPDITLWTAWQDRTLAGCAALRELSASHGEIKSMRTTSSHLRQGVATQLLHHLIAVAKERGYVRLSLETGNTLDFAAARALYRQFGFALCPPFGSYVDDGFSICMTRTV